MTRKSNSFLFSSKEGKDLAHQILQGLWPYAPWDYWIEAVTKVLDGIDVLAILPTSAGKTVILMMFMLILIHIKSNPENFTSHCSWFLDDPIAIVVYLMNCLEEEQVRVVGGGQRVQHIPLSLLPPPSLFRRPVFSRV